MKCMLVKEGTIGYGNQVPPIWEHVKIWFLHNGAHESIGKSFFDHYTDCKWKNNNGILIKNWKVHAWKWRWEKEHL